MIDETKSSMQGSVPDVSDHPPARRLLVIGAGGSRFEYWREMWRFRDLAYFLALRDILVRYKQTAIGVSWGLIRPLLTMLALAWVFGRGARLQSGSPDIPYTLWVFAAMLPWQFFSDAVTAASSSLVNNSSMVSKIYFPRLLLPASKMFISFVDFGISFFLLLAMVIAFHFSSYRFSPDWRFILVPVLLLPVFAVSLGAGVLFAALNVKYRDFTYVVPFAMMFGLYVSPVGISTNDLTHGQLAARLLFSLNPMVGIIDLFRWAVFGPRAAPLSFPGLTVSGLVAAALVLSGVRYFRRAEGAFADII